MELASAPGSQIRDAEMSVEYLCRKFEALTDQLCREESAREVVERHGAKLFAEVASAEAAIAQRSSTLTAELIDKDASLLALRASAQEADRRVALESAKAREEQASEIRLEQECAQFSEQCRSEAVQCEQISSRVTTQDREVMQERCEHSEVGRRLRQIQADTRVVLEDLRIAQQRSLLMRSELHTLEANFDAKSRAHEQAACEADAHVKQLEECRRQLGDSEARVEAMSTSLDKSRLENMAQDRRLSLLHEEESAAQSQQALLRQDLQAIQQDGRKFSLELHTELEASSAAVQELRLVEQRRAHDAHEASSYRRSLAETEACLESVRKSISDRRVVRETVAGQLAGLTAEEEGHTAASSELRRTRHMEDMAFDDAQSELQIAFKRRESLSEDLALKARSREEIVGKLRWLRPEAAEAEERCRDLEQQLAQRAHDVEEEIMQQRHYQQEVVAVSDAVIQAQKEEARLEAELHHATIFQDAAVSAAALIASGGSRPGSRPGSRAGSPAPAGLRGMSSRRGASSSRPSSPSLSGRHRSSSTSAPRASQTPPGVLSAPGLAPRFFASQSQPRSVGIAR